MATPHLRKKRSVLDLFRHTPAPLPEPSHEPRKPYVPAHAASSFSRTTTNYTNAPLRPTDYDVFLQQARTTELILTHSASQQAANTTITTATESGRSSDARPLSLGSEHSALSPALTRTLTRTVPPTQPAAVTPSAPPTSAPMPVPEPASAQHNAGAKTLRRQRSFAQRVAEYIRPSRSEWNLRKDAIREES